MLISTNIIVGTFVYDSLFFVGSESLVNRQYVFLYYLWMTSFMCVIAGVTALKPLTLEGYERKDRGP